MDFKTSNSDLFFQTQTKMVTLRNKFLEKLAHVKILTASKRQEYSSKSQHEAGGAAHPCHAQPKSRAYKEPR